MRLEKITMRALLKLAIVQVKLFLREPAAFFFTLVFPALLLVLFGAIFGNTPNPQFNPNYGFIDTEVPALAGIIIGTVSLMSVPIATATAREHKILRRYRSTPLSPLTYLAADVLVNFCVALAGMFILILIAKVFYGLRFGGNWLSVLGAFSLSCLAFLTAGYVVASLAPTARVAQVIGQVAYFPMMFLSGAAFPREIMPEGVRRVGDVLPLTVVVKLLQGLWYGEAWGGYWVETAILCGMAVVGIILVSRVFRWE
jgi:ABC-2 type transport system permease protein